MGSLPVILRLKNKIAVKIKKEVIKPVILPIFSIM
jgi:hypothetical protein